MDTTVKTNNERMSKQGSPFQISGGKDGVLSC